MKYMVQWRPAVEAKLADIWIRSAYRDAITAAAHAVDIELAISPESKGQDFYGDLLVFVSPLHVVYTIEPDDLRVWILDLWVV